ncbi:MAG: hypothetical protein ACR2H1_07945, partial [Limisphaerales bacterium]
ADIVVTGLPRETEPLGESLLDAIKPRLIIVTDAESPATERASVKLRERLAARNIPILYCRESGAVTLNIGPAGCSFRTATGKQISPKKIRGASSSIIRRLDIIN